MATTRPLSPELHREVLDGSEHTDELATTHGGDFDITRTAQQALYAELRLLENEERAATPGELDRINSLAARVGKEQHPAIQTRGEFAAVWSQIASGYDLTNDPLEHQRIEVELACFAQAYPDFK